MKLTKKEKELRASVEAGEWKSVKDFPSEKKRFEKIARHTVRNDKRIRARILQRTNKGIH